MKIKGGGFEMDPGKESTLPGLNLRLPASRKVSNQGSAV